jgi:hypothetical protein
MFILFFFIQFTLLFWFWLIQFSFSDFDLRTFFRSQTLSLNKCPLSKRSTVFVTKPLPENAYRVHTNGVIFNLSQNDERGLFAFSLEKDFQLNVVFSNDHNTINFGLFHLSFTHSFIHSLSLIIILVLILNTLHIFLIILFGSIFRWVEFTSRCECASLHDRIRTTKRRTRRSLWKPIPQHCINTY